MGRRTTENQHLDDKLHIIRCSKNNVDRIKADNSKLIFYYQDEEGFHLIDNRKGKWEKFSELTLSKLIERTEGKL